MNTRDSASARYDNRSWSASTLVLIVQCVRLGSRWMLDRNVSILSFLSLSKMSYSYYQDALLRLANLITCAYSPAGKTLQLRVVQHPCIDHSTIEWYPRPINRPTSIYRLINDQPIARDWSESLSQ